MTDNPFERGYIAPEPAPVHEPETSEPEQAQPAAKAHAADGQMITEPGAYPDIDNEVYHHVEICDGPSISSTGLKTIESKSPLHYWFNSPLNPSRPEPAQKRHFNVGKAVHDRILLQGLFPKQYFILPADYDGRLKKFRDVKEERNAAEEAGVPVLFAKEAQMVEAVAEQVEKHDLARLLLTAGTPEMTVAAKDPVTGVWMRCRPDVLPDTTEIIPDIKTTISAHPAAFEKQATNLGYFQSAAFYIDVIAEAYGPATTKRRFLLIAAEKEPPHPVQIYQLDDEAIQNGRMLNRKALNTFAECLRTGVWPAYSHPEHNPILPLTMSRFAHSEINRRVDSGELSYED